MDQRSPYGARRRPGCRLTEPGATGSRTVHWRILLLRHRVDLSVGLAFVLLAGWLNAPDGAARRALRRTLVQLYGQGTRIADAWTWRV